jgi:hypothetical protein
MKTPHRQSTAAITLNRRNFLRLTAIGSVASCTVLSIKGEVSDQAVVLDLDPSKDNPRNSEGGFITLKSGRVLFVYTRFYGRADDASPAQLVSIDSADAGLTWSKPHKVVVGNEGKANVMSVSLLRLKDGSIALFYLVKNSLIDCRPVMRVSTDEGESWSDPRLITDAPGYFVLNNDRVVQLRSGRLILPVALHRSRHADPKSYRSFDSRGIVLWYLSDDVGKTWREAKDWWALPVRSRTGLQEPGVVELADGRLFSWMRTDQGVQYGCWSNDGGETWPLPEKTELASPASPASIKRVPDSADLLAIFNDHSGAFPFPKGKRSPLVSAISVDGGRTWGQRKSLESDPNGWYCYTAIHFAEDSVLLGYCAGDTKVGGLNRLRIRRVGLESLRA